MPPSENLRYQGEGSFVAPFTNVVEFKKPAIPAVNVENPQLKEIYNPYQQLIGVQAFSYTPMRVYNDSNEAPKAMPDDLTDAKIAAAEARTETKIARIEGKIDTMGATLGAKLDVVSDKLAEHARDRNLILGTIALAALAVIGAFIALATYGDALFGRGMDVRDVVQTVIREQQQSPPSLPIPPKPNNHQ